MQKTSELYVQLQSMVPSNRPNLCDANIKVFEDLITEYKGKCTVMKTGDYGQTDSTTISMLERREMLKDMKQCGVTEQANNPWLFPVVIIHKKNGDFCLDYRKLNDITKRGCFPPPRINNTQHTLAGA
jgi:hypothetical protein